MAKVKKINLLVLSILLAFAGIFFVSCGDVDYSNVTLICEETNVTLDIEQELEINFTIQNYIGGTSGELNIHNDDPTVVSYEKSVPNGGVTTLRLKGLKGGTAHIRAVTVDGNKDCTITVTVRQYADTITKKDKNLYVTYKSEFIPTANDFVFNGNARDLSYYFYGMVPEDWAPLTLEDIKDENEYINEFTSVKLIKQGGENYLIFKNSQDKLFTLENGNYDFTQKQKIRFKEVSLSEDGVTYNVGDAKPIKLGENYTFIAKYANLDDPFVQSDFYILGDIGKAEYKFYYEILRGQGEDKEEISEEIVLIPNLNDENEKYDYKGVKLVVTLPSKSSLVRNDYYFDTNHLSVSEMFAQEDENTYVFRIENKASTTLDTKLHLQFYFEGLKDSDDESVNYNLEIPVKITYQPTDIYVNNKKDPDKLEFYDNYSGDFGWQYLNLSVSPKDSIFNSMKIKYDPDTVAIKYNGVEQSQSEFEIRDLSQPLLVRGGKEIGNGEITLEVSYDILGESKTIEKTIFYTVNKGASRILPVDDYYKNTGVYLPVQNSDSIIFQGFYANAPFKYATLRFKAGEDSQDVIRMEGEASCGKYFREGDKEGYPIVIYLRTRGVLGSGVYTLSLDNGTSEDIRFEVSDSFDGRLGIKYENANGAITKTESISSTEEDSLGGVRLFILNKEEKTNASVKLVANDNDNSTVIQYVNPSNRYGEGFIYNYRAIDKMFTITTTGNGNGYIIIDLSLITVSDDFKIERVNRKFKLEVVSYSLIERMNVYKLQDGKNEYPKNTSASFAEVYVGTDNESVRKAVFNVVPRKEGYYFYDQRSNEYKNETFNIEKIYWTYENIAPITCDPNNRYKEYSIGEFGTFNPYSMTFTANSSAGEFSLILVANIRQLNTTYSYSITISSSIYQEVTELTLANSQTEINFSSQNRPSSRHKDLIVYNTTENATNPDIRVIFNPASVAINETTQFAYILGERIQDGKYDSYEGIQKIKQDDGSYLVTLDVSETFINSDLSKSKESLSGQLMIVATDWLDQNGNIKQSYMSRVINITVNFNNGTSNNPFKLETTEDVLQIRNALNANYSISTTIKLSEEDNKSLPLGEFSGIIIGDTNYSCISGLNITDNTKLENYYGLFTSVSGKIENVQFEGSININNAEDNANIGLVTAINNGTLTNIGVKITANSSVITQGTANIGLVAGINNGTITQDYTKYKQGDILSPHILAYMANNISLNITANGNVNVGGVVGLNKKSISKIDNENLILAGYTSYLSYVNITVTRNNHNITDYVGGVAGQSVEGSVIDGSNEIFKAGDGILVGGKIEGISYVGGIVGNFAGTTLKGITARAFVRGYSGAIGAISGNLAAAPMDVGDYYVQAVDDGRVGVESSMIIRYWTKDSETTSFNLDTIAFGAKGGLTVMTGDNIKTYVDRNRINIEADSAGITNINSSLDEYYGDYIEVLPAGEAWGITTIKKQHFFDLDSSPWSIKANEGFNSFNGNVFYAYYFEAFGGDKVTPDSLLKAQNILNQHYNTLSSNSVLYPISSSVNGLLLSSQNSNKLFIDENGQMTIKGVGETIVEVKNVLNTNENKSRKIRIKAVNYFNSDEELSIVYDSATKGNRPIDESRFEIKGNNSVSLYVKPDYTLKDKSDIEIFNSNGQGNIDGIGIVLAPNTEIVPELEIMNFANLDGTISSNKPDLNIMIDGQSVVINRSLQSEEGIYNFKIKTKLVSNEGYKCYVNKEITQTNVVYTKGAEEIRVRYESVPVYTYKQSENVISVNSQSKEDKPLYAIFDKDGNPLQGDEGLGHAYKFESEGNANLFVVDFNPNVSDKTGWQDFVMNISVNRGSPYYEARHSLDIYQNYYIRVYAASNFEVACDIPFKLLSMTVTDISIDNYPKITEVESTKDFSTSSLKAEAGNSGLLVVNITPDDADYDYIEIVNTELASVAGNGKGSFSLVGRNLKSDGGNSSELFVENSVVGSPIPNGLRIYWEDINRFYTGENVEKYHGVIYIKYMVGTNNVVDGAKAEFKVTVFNKGNPVKNNTIRLDVHLENKVIITIDGKTQNADMSYNVARGLKYKLNLDYHGFTFSDIEMPKVYAYEGMTNGVYNKTTISNVAYVTEENGSYYLNIKSDAINYAEYEFGYPIIVSTNALHKEGEIERKASFDMPVNILEYVINYQYTEGDALRDIVEGMDNGVIHVQIGNIQSLKVDLTSILEYDTTNDSVVTKVNTFIDSMTQSATWKAFTNLNESDVAVMGSVTTKKFQTSFDITPANTFDNAYFVANGLNITPVVTHNFVNSYYIFSFRNSYKIESRSGIYSVATEGAELYTEFRFNVYQSSSSENPIPIYNEKQLMSMQANSHYILLEDIELSDKTFSPIENEVASLDGNGHTIYFNGDYSLSGENLGLFRRIGTDAVIKNVTIALKGDTNFRTDASSFNAGLLAGENSGNITNCYVHSGRNAFTLEEYTFSAFCPSQDNASCYVAGIVGRNNGNITNCRSSLNITSNFNIAGIAGVNTRKIASSYYKNGKLECNSQYGHKIGGLVVENGTSATSEEDRNVAVIMTSYVSGQPEKGIVYTNDTDHYIKSSQPTAGLAFTNNGKISDCYTNINMQGTSTIAGFVHENAGSIKNCFSLSKLVDEVNTSAGFAMENTVEGVVGKFENCYYLYRPSGTDQEPINSSINDKKFKGTSRLQESDFANLEGLFSDYSYAKTTSVNSVWFFSSGNTSSIFDEVQFGSNRLELVAPNVIAKSQKILNRSYEDTSGNVVYEYIYSKDSAPLGSLKNPYIIESAEVFEKQMLAPMTQSGFNNNNYRLIADINYSNISQSSQTYKLIYFGTFEGNGMTISQNRLYSNDTLTNAGLFGQIGKDSSHQGTVMNLTLQPKEIAFTSTNCVGALAGTLSYGNIYNVEVYTEESLNVLGSNFVGGVIGRAINSYDMKNVTSSVSAVAYYTPEDVTSTTVDTNSYTQNSMDISRYSYAGGVVGFAGGDGNIQKIFTKDIVNIMGDRVGIAIGGIDKNVKVEYLHVELLDSLRIKAFTYGGLAIGEVKGNLDKVQIKGNGGEYFSLSPEVPTAVGGITGLLAGGKITNAYSDVFLKVPNKNIDGRTYEVASVGGIAGLVAYGEAEINDSLVSGNIEAVTINLGGIVGSAERGLRLSRIAMKADRLAASGRVRNVSVGGLVGSGTDSMIIEDAYALADIEVATHVSNTDITANIGGFVGSGVPSIMQRCFTTAKITANLQDKTQVGGIEIITTSGNGYEFNIQKNEYNNVIYFGSEQTENISDLFISFAGKRLNNKVALKVNSLGKPSVQLGANAGATNVTDKSYVTTWMIEMKKADADKTEDKKQWTAWILNDDETEIYLEFEDAFTWLR